MISSRLLTDHRIRLALATVAGAALCAAFAPMNLWLLGLLSPAVLMALWQQATPRHAAALGFCFNFGTFTAGTYWLLISIHVVGEKPLWIALVVMAALLCILSLYGALLGWMVAAWLPPSGPMRWLVGLPSAWLLEEWFRGWFLTGFPWLSLGYSQTGTWMAGIAPVSGVYGVSALLLLGSGALLCLALGSRRERLLGAVVLVLVWVVPGLLRGVAWTHPSGGPVSVAIVQGAVPANEKWAEEHYDEQFDIYRDLTRSALGAQVIIWPEAAVPDAAQNISDYLLARYQEAHAHQSALVVGVFRKRTSQQGRPPDVFNSLLTMGDEAADWYDKQHLVPFTEIIPGPAFAHQWLAFMDLDIDEFTRGASDQPPVRADALVLLPAICYDDGFGSSNLHMLPAANALVTVTNDGWFGHSTARYHHLQIAQMRSIETGRYLIRAANDGVSAIIGADGRVLAAAPEYVPTVLRGTVVPMQGMPPYARFGNWLIILLGTAALVTALIRERVARA
ncbi:MAG: apolipoprotein N-acyltransferase [Steroidobacteraceae bacterium]